jgi:3-isopropylmalate/(R)-2-methylmalate dehydratase large subunit
MVAHPGDPDHGVPSDPTNGARVEDIGEVPIDIAYAGSCTAGKIEDLLFYHQVAREAVEAGLRVAPGVEFIIQCGSEAVERFIREHGFLETFAKAGARVIPPGCGACIGCGPGVSEQPDRSRSRPSIATTGPLRPQAWLASPLTVAARRSPARSPPTRQNVRQRAGPCGLGEKRLARWGLWCHP